MATINALEPTPEQIKGFLAHFGDDEPVFMLNLLKFKEKATYKDGEDVSGREAYSRYAKAFTEMLADLNIEGVSTSYSGNLGTFLIGQGEGEWDACAVVRYPSAKTMFETVSSDRYRSFYKHRMAGLEGQLLIACDGEGMF